MMQWSGRGRHVREGVRILKTRHAVARVVQETLEPRSYLAGDDLSAGHGGGCFCAVCAGAASGGAVPTYTSVDQKLINAITASAVVDHAPEWYKATGTVSLAAAGAAGAAPTFSTNSAGLPLLTQRADDKGLKIFLDFDGYNNDTPFSIDGDGSTFNAEEQTAVYDTWRTIISYFSFLNVNVTTVQPTLGGTPFIWHRISNSISGGAALVGAISNNSSNSWTGPEGGRDRRSAVAHEVGHQLGLSHQAEQDRYGDETTDYSDGYDDRSRPIMGVDYAENVRQWFYGRNSDNAANLVNEIPAMASKVASIVGDDGFRPDDHAATLAGATLLGGAGGISAGVIERTNDSDLFKFVSVGGTYHIDATPTFESSFEAKLELLDANGTVIASRDDADQRNWRMNDQEFDVGLTAGATYYVRISSSGDQSEIGEYVVTAAPLPGNGWASADINAATIQRGGTAAYDPATGILTQMAGGTDIWNQNDSFRFTYTTLTGDGSITARVDSLDNTAFHAKAGVMIRASTADNSPHVFMGLKPSGQLDPIARNATGAGAYNAGASVASTNRWVRITKLGNTYTLGTSPDGVNWTTVSTQTISMGSTLLIGFATTATNGRAQTYAQYSGISLTGNLGTAAPTYNGLASPTISTIAAASGQSTGVTLSWAAVADAIGYIVQRSVDGVSFSDIATLAGSTLSYADNGLFGSMRYFYRIVAQGTGNTRSAPGAARNVVNKPSAPTLFPTNYQPAVQTPSPSRVYLNWKDTQGETGYRVERSTNGGTSWTTLTTTPVNATGYNDTTTTANTSYVYRITPVSASGDGPSLLINAATRLNQVTNFRFTSLGSTTASLAWTDTATETGYRIERSTDATNWSTIATLPADTTSYNDTGLSPVTHYYYRLVAFNASVDSVPSVIFGATQPSTALPAGWSGGDIGNVPGQGSSGVSGSVWTVIGTGNDIYDSADAFQYLRRTSTGDATIVARVVSFENHQDYAKAGVMFRATTAAGSINVNLAYTPNGGIEFNSRGTANNGTATNQRVTLAENVVPYLKLQRTGNLFTASYSTNGSSWTTIGSITISMPTSALVGLAVTSHNTSRISKATFDNVALTGGVVISPPTIVTAAAANPGNVTTTTTAVSVTATDNGGEANLTYTWSATGPNGAPVVTFTNNGTNAGKNATATFGAAGSYVLTVTVTDADGQSTTSSVPVTVTSTPSSILLTPAAPPATLPGSVTNFTAIVRDQFGATLNSISPTWSASAGTIDASGAWTAPNVAGRTTITATSGSLTGTAMVNTRFISTASTYDWDATLPSLRFTFNGDPGTSLTASDLVLTRVAADGSVLETIAPTSVDMLWDAASRTATFRFPGYANGTLPNGNYRAKIVAGAAQDGGSNFFLSQDASSNFFTLAGDVDHDRDVDFADLLTLAKAYNQTGKTASQGNVDYSADGLVSFSDLLILAKNYGGTVVGPAAAFAATATPATTTSKTRTRVASEIL